MITRCQLVDGLNPSRRDRMPINAISLPNARMNHPPMRRDKWGLPDLNFS